MHEERVFLADKNGIRRRLGSGWRYCGLYGTEPRPMAERHDARSAGNAPAETRTELTSESRTEEHETP